MTVAIESRVEEIRAELKKLEALPRRETFYGEPDPISAESRSVTIAELEGELRGLQEATQ